MAIHFDDLLFWAKAAIRKTGLAGMTQVSCNGSMLQVSCGEAIFDGKKVVK